MKRPSFFHGVLVAAVLGFFASAIVATLTPFVGFGAVLRLVIPALALTYLLYLFSRSEERVGRVTTLFLWSALAAVTWWVAPPLPLYLLIHVGAIWLVRSLYFYSGVMPALLDLGLSSLSICATVWAIVQSGSVFLATWCFLMARNHPPLASENVGRDQHLFILNTSCSFRLRTSRPDEHNLSMAEGQRHA